MKHAIIKAIKNLDIQQLNNLLPEDKSYMDVSKKRFLKALSKSFQTLKDFEILAFDEVHAGTCQSCNKGCEAYTFFSKQGFYIDIYIESKDNEMIDDMYICNKIENTTELKKEWDLGFYFKEEEKVNFKPDQKYLQTKKEYQELVHDLKTLKQPISIDTIENLLEEYHSLQNTNNNFDPFDALNYKLYPKVSKLIGFLEDLYRVKTEAEIAINGMADYYNAKTERDKLIWYYQQEEYDNYLFPHDLPIDKENKTFILAINKLQLTIDYKGYEYVIDFFLAIDEVYHYFINKYKPLPEHYQNAPDGKITHSLENFLSLHQVHIDIIKKYQQEN